MTMQERIDAAKAAMIKIHNGLAHALEGVTDFEALDTPENTADLDERDVRALRRELNRLGKMIGRSGDEADDVHEALNAIASWSQVISPAFNK